MESLRGVYWESVAIPARSAEVLVSRRAVPHRHGCASNDMVNYWTLLSHVAFCSVTLLSQFSSHQVHLHSLPPRTHKVSGTKHPFLCNVFDHFSSHCTYPQLSSFSLTRVFLTHTDTSDHFFAIPHPPLPVFTCQYLPGSCPRPSNSITNTHDATF